MIIKAKGDVLVSESLSNYQNKGGQLTITAKRTHWLKCIKSLLG